MSDDTSRLQTQDHTCDLCGQIMISLHCKFVCTNCGYRRDCSDPEPARPNWADSILHQIFPKQPSFSRPMKR